MIEQRQVAERNRVRGNEAYKGGQLSEAYRFYSLGLEHQKHNMELHSNASLTSLKLGCFIQAIEHCDKVQGPLQKVLFNMWEKLHIFYIM